MTLELTLDLGRPPSRNGSAAPLPRPATPAAAQRPTSAAGPLARPASAAASARPSSAPSAGPLARPSSSPSSAATAPVGLAADFLFAAAAAAALPRRPASAAAGSFAASGSFAAPRPASAGSAGRQASARSASQPSLARPALARDAEGGPEKAKLERQLAAELLAKKKQAAGALQWPVGAGAETADARVPPEIAKLIQAKRRAGRTRPCPGDAPVIRAARPRRHTVCQRRPGEPPRRNDAVPTPSLLELSRPQHNIIHYTILYYTII